MSSDQQDLTLLVGTINGKLDQVIDLLKGHVEDDITQFKDKDERLKKLETKQAWMAGVGAAVAALLSYVVGTKTM